jgi:hypothetical protein
MPILDELHPLSFDNVQALCQIGKDIPNKRDKQNACLRF